MLNSNDIDLSKSDDNLVYSPFIKSNDIDLSKSDNNLVYNSFIRKSHDLRFFNIGMNFYESTNYKKIIKYAIMPMYFDLIEFPWWRWYADFYGFYYSRPKRSYFLYVTMDLKSNVLINLSKFIKIPNPKYDKYNMEFKKRFYLHWNSFISFPKLIYSYSGYNFENNWYYKKYFYYLNFMFPITDFLSSKCKEILYPRNTNQRYLDLQGNFGQEIDTFISSYNAKGYIYYLDEQYGRISYKQILVPKNYTVVIASNFMCTNIYTESYDSDLLVYSANYLKFYRDLYKCDKLYPIIKLFNLELNLKFFSNIMFFYCSFYLKNFFYQMNKYFNLCYNNNIDYYKINLYYYFIKYINNKLYLSYFNKWYLYKYFLYKYFLSFIFIFKNYFYKNNLENLYLNYFGFINNLKSFKYLSKFKFKFNYFLKFINKFNYCVNFNLNSKLYYIKKFNYFFMIYLNNKKNFLYYNKKFFLHNINKLNYNIFILKFIMNLKNKLNLNNNLFLFKFFYLLKPSLIFEKFKNFFYVKKINIYSKFTLSESNLLYSKKFINRGYFTFKQNFKFIFYKYYSELIVKNLLEFIYAFSNIIMSNLKLNFRNFLYQFTDEDVDINNIFFEYSKIIRIFISKFLYFYKKIFKLCIYKKNLKFNIYEKIFFSYYKFYKFRKYLNEYKYLNKYKYLSKYKQFNYIFINK